MGRGRRVGTWEREVRRGVRCGGWAREKVEREVKEWGVRVRFYRKGLERARMGLKLGHDF
jgi:hypothetical protein